MKPRLQAVAILITALACSGAGMPAQAAPVPAAVLPVPVPLQQTAPVADAGQRQDPALLRQAVEQFLQRQSGGLPGEVVIEVGQVDARLNLPACMQPEPFIAHGSRAWGKTAVGIRCTAPAPWTIYVTANVHVMAEYLAAAAPLVQGQMIGAGDIARVRGDLTMLPAGVITDSTQAIGRTTMSSVQLGAPLRKDTLRAQAAVQMGQTIRLLSAGPGFSVSTEGRAMNNAAEGQTVQAKTSGGQIISGIARAGGVLEVAH